MKKKILSHTSVMIVLTVILTFIAASFVMYDKFNSTMTVSYTHLTLPTTPYV